MRHVPFVLLLVAVLAVTFGGPAAPPVSAEPAKPVVVPKDAIRFDDGDTIEVHWADADAPEVVRILGIDAPEVVHLAHDIPFTQPFGEAATGFLRGALAVADEVTLLRAAEKDPYGRTLGYVFLDGKNYSVLVIEARLAVETVTHFGDNGLPEPAADCVAAAKRAGTVAFEAPHRYRRRMRDVAKQMRAEGTYPEPDDAK